MIWLLESFLQPNRLGIAAGPDAMIRFAPGLVRRPAVSVIRRDRLPDGRCPREAIAPVVLDIAVEILSPTNTHKEIARKLQEYFEAGVRPVWIVDPRKQTVRVHTSEEESLLLKSADVFDGGDVLPGFQLSIREWFERAE